MCILNLIYETWSKYVQVFFVQRFSRMPDFKFCFLSACVGSTTPNKPSRGRDWTQHPRNIWTKPFKTAIWDMYLYLHLHESIEINWNGFEMVSVNPPLKASSDIAAWCYTACTCSALPTPPRQLSQRWKVTGIQHSNKSGTAFNR